MLRLLSTGIAVSVFAATLALAQDSSATPKSCCAGGAEAKAVAGEGTTCNKEVVAKACANMPAMTYKIGDKTTCCSHQADELAKGDAKAIKFVVAEKEYSDKTEALKAYNELLGGHLKEITTVKYAVGKECMACPVSAGEMAKKEGKKVEYRLASFNFAEKTSAEKAATVAKEAAEKVSIKVVVGERQFACPIEAGTVAKASGKPMEFVIGEVHTQCYDTAQVELAKARIEAALAAIAKIDGATFASAAG